MNIYLLAYGSLRNPQSRALTLPGKRLTSETALRGYIRKFNAPVDGYLYLNIAPKPDSQVSGTLISLSSDELERVKLREPGYDCIEVGRLVRNTPDGLVFVFVAPNVKFADMKIPRSYIETCLSGMSAREKETWLQETIFENNIEEDLENPVYANASNLGSIPTPMPKSVPISS